MTSGGWLQACAHNCYFVNFVPGIDDLIIGNSDNCANRSELGGFQRQTDGNVKYPSPIMGSICVRYADFNRETMQNTIANQKISEASAIWNCEEDDENPLEFFSLLSDAVSESSEVRRSSLVRFSDQSELQSFSIHCDSLSDGADSTISNLLSSEESFRAHNSCSSDISTDSFDSKSNFDWRVRTENNLASNNETRNIISRIDKNCLIVSPGTRIRNLRPLPTFQKKHL